MAAVAMMTGIGPADLLAAPPEVYEAIVELLEERERQRRLEDMRGKLRHAAGS